MPNLQISNDDQLDGSDNDAVVGNSDEDLRTALSELKIHNKMLLERLSQKHNNNSITNNNINPAATVNTHDNRNGYFVISDINNSLTEFSGREANHEAQLWIDSVDSVARLHGYQKASKWKLSGLN